MDKTFEELLIEMEEATKKEHEVAKKRIGPSALALALQRAQEKKDETVSIQRG